MLSDEICPYVPTTLMENFNLFVRKVQYGKYYVFHYDGKKVLFGWENICYLSDCYVKIDIGYHINIGNICNYFNSMIF